MESLRRIQQEMLCKFYAPCQKDGKRSGNGLPDPSALAADSSCLWEDAPGARGRIFASIAVALACELITLYLLCTLPLLLNFVLFVAACVTFVALQKLAGGIDKVILHHADRYPEPHHVCVKPSFPKPLTMPGLPRDDETDCAEGLVMDPVTRRCGLSHEPELYTFYVYRLGSGSWTNANAGSLGAVLYTIHSKILGCPRQRGIDRIHRLKVTMKNTEKLFRKHGHQFGPLHRFRNGQCISSFCNATFREFGFLAPKSVRALSSELKCAWGTAGTRAVATDICCTAIRQVRALRRLGISGAGKARASSPVAPPQAAPAAGASEPQVPVPPAEEATTAAAPDPPREEPPPEPPVAAGSKPATEVKEEEKSKPAESESDYTEDDEESEKEERPQSGLKVVPKSSPPPRPERSEIPRRRTSDRSHHSPRAGRDRAREEESEYPRSSYRRESRERPRRSRSRGHREHRRPEDHKRHRERQEPGKKKKKKRKGHRGGSRHQQFWKAESDPFRKFHTRQPDSFWDRQPGW
eukprot:s163_g24.t1